MAAVVPFRCRGSCLATAVPMDPQALQDWAAHLLKIQAKLNGGFDHSSASVLENCATSGMTLPLALLAMWFS